MPIFFKPAIIDALNDLNHDSFSNDTGYIIFSNEDDAIYVKIDGSIKRYGGLNPINNLDSDSTNEPLSASMGKLLKTYIENIDSSVEDLDNAKIKYEDIVDDLEHQNSNKPLSAKQGYELNQKIIYIEGSKVNKSDIADVLDSIDSYKVLSANQGSILNNRLSTLENDSVRSYDIVNDLTHTDTDKPLSASQGTYLNSKVQELTNSKIDYQDIVNDLTQLNVTDKPLSAGMGAFLYVQILSILDRLLTIPQVLDVLDSIDSRNALSANQGRILNEKIEALDAGFYGKVIRVRDKEAIDNLEIIEIFDDTDSLDYIYGGPYVTEITDSIVIEGNQYVTPIPDWVLPSDYEYIDPSIVDTNTGIEYPYGDIEIVEIYRDYSSYGLTILDGSFSIIRNNRASNLGSDYIVSVNGQNDIHIINIINPNIVDTSNGSEYVNNGIHDIITDYNSYGIRILNDDTFGFIKNNTISNSSIEVVNVE